MCNVAANCELHPRPAVSGVPPDSEYTFKHALVQDDAYSTLLRSRRQQIHSRIVTTLEKQFPEVASTQPALMAQHCREAGLKEKAVRFWLNAWSNTPFIWCGPSTGWRCH